MESTLQGCCEIDFGGMSLKLLPCHAVYWAAEKTAFIADTHFGKAETFHSLSIPIPTQMCQDLRRLDQLLNETGCERLIVLGDLIHSRRGRSPQMESEFTSWRRKYSQLTIQLVRGNHDKAAGDPCSEWDIECLDATVKIGTLTLTHSPEFDSDNWTLCGHLHPKMKISSQAEDLRCPAFLLRHRTLVLPAFAQFIDHGIVRPEDDDVFYAVAETEVIPFSTKALRQQF